MFFLLTGIEGEEKKWTLLHDQKTKGIMGFLPLVDDMPVKITETDQDNNDIIFKNRRCRIAGWTLHENDKARYEKCTSQEMNLDHMPKEIFVRIEKATWIWSKDLGPGVIGVKPTAVIWHTDPKDKVGVRKRGFQIAPDFSGTAHAFAGASLKSVLIDILEWHRKPSKDDQISAYMCVSRIQHIDDLCIMQPYAPTLFQQGELDGPDLLLRFLRGDVPLRNLQREWAALNKQSKKEVWKSAGDIPLYCRGCSAKTGEIVENKKANRKKLINSHTLHQTESGKMSFLWAWSVSATNAGQEVDR